MRVLITSEKRLPNPTRFGPKMISAIRSRGDITVAAAQDPTIPATPDSSHSPAAPAKTSASAKPVGKAALSNPKTPEEADGMIAWEQRDIDSQQEYVDRLQTELEQAPPERREHLQSAIAERQQALADTPREQQQFGRDSLVGPGIAGCCPTAAE
jgi:hypothetical protein